jgi:hypothetical protein
MDVGKVLAELRQELVVLDAAIASLERLQNAGPPRKKMPAVRKPDRTSHRRASARTSPGAGKAE